MPDSPTGDDDFDDANDTVDSSDTDTGDANSADSSIAGDSKDAKPSTAAEAVAQALGEGDRFEEQPSGSDKEGEEKSDKEAAESSPEDKAKAEAEAQAREDEKLPFHNHPRWKAVVEERNTLREENESLKAQSEGFESGYKAMSSLRDYMQSNSIGQDEFNNALAIMSEMKRNPSRALELLQPTLEQLYSAVGAILPPDLQKEVDEGIISEQRARELATARDHNKRFEDAQKKAQADARQDAIDRVESAVAEWDKRWKSSDPDYGKLSPYVSRAFKLFVLEQKDAAARQGRDYLPSVKDVLDKLAALREAEQKSFSASFPKDTRDITPESMGVRSKPKAAPEPKTALEAVTLGLGSADY